MNQLFLKYFTILVPFSLCILSRDTDKKEIRKMMEYYDEIDNIKLIKNGLKHLLYELEQDKPSWYRIAREAHLVLYRSMIEALKGTNNFTITGKKSKNREHTYILGNDQWKRIKKISINGCDKAWRFSSPEVLNPQPPSPLELQNNAIETQSNYQSIDDFLILLYDALAMIQAENFMETLVHSKKVSVSDEDMQKLEWLHEYVRNPYEHFVPSTHLATKKDLCSVTELCLSLSRELLFESGNVYFHNESEKEDITDFFNAIMSKLISD